MSSRADAVVVGAGSSGAAAAALLAERGMRVICVERRPLERAGAAWVNGVPRAAFAEAGIALPGDTGESDGRPAPFHLVASGGRALVPEHDVIDIDMRKLVARLQVRAAAAGVDLRGEVTVRGRDGGRLETSAGTIDAHWIIDASGLAGARLLDQPKVDRDDLCAAAQEVREIIDRDAARAFFDHHRVRPGEVLGLIGVAGGYSVLNVRLRNDGLLGILTGSIPALGFPSGKAILDDFVAQHAWVGPRVFGGSGPISLRRPHDRLADDRVALIGDAGCQVFPAHGSGVGAGMIAARMLADTLAAGGTPRDYEVAWQRRHGGLFAFFDVFRRWNQTIDDATLSRVMHLGLLDTDTLRAGIDQVLPRPSLRALASKVQVLARNPALARTLAAAGARGVAVRALYARYPRRAEAVPTWARAVDWLLSAGS
jgi:flavin-dependent dehydrogenase